MEPPTILEPLNDAEIADYSSIDHNRLKLPWHLPNLRVNRSEDWARDCTVIVKGIPETTNECELFQFMLTLNGELPWYNHEVIATTYPVDAYWGNRRRGIAFIRWSNPNFARRCCTMFNHTYIGDSRIRVEISRGGVLKVDNERRNKGYVLGGIRLYDNVWEPMDQSSLGKLNAR